MISVLNPTLLSGFAAVSTTMVLTNALIPILGPHLEPRCESVTHAAARTLHAQGGRAASASLARGKADAGAQHVCV